MGCHRRLCLARLLSRYGCGLVTVFENIFVRRCQLHSVPTFSRHQTITFKLPSAQSRVGLFFCSVPTHKKHPHLSKTYSFQKSKTPPSPCVQETEVAPCLFLIHLVLPPSLQLADGSRSSCLSLLLKIMLISSYLN